MILVVKLAHQRYSFFAVTVQIGKRLAHFPPVNVDNWREHSEFVQREKLSALVVPAAGTNASYIEPK